MTVSAYYEWCHLLDCLARRVRQSDVALSALVMDTVETYSSLVHMIRKSKENLRITFMMYGSFTQIILYCTTRFGLLTV